MLRSDFYFDLPEELIAQTPLDKRSASRLLCLGAADAEPRDCQFSQFHELLNPGDLLVVNDTRVIPARLWGRKETGGKVEILIERLLDSCRCLARIRASKPPKLGTQIELGQGFKVEIVVRHDDFFELEVSTGQTLSTVLNLIGHVPLPPYIRRPENSVDLSRYQTVYADRPGAVAAPTAGLHFDEPMLQRLRKKGVKIVSVTLHVGAGTFEPVRVNHIRDHQLHEEWMAVSQQVVDSVNAAKGNGCRVAAVGTTSVRALESAARTGQIQETTGGTRIFIYPGYKFRVIDALLTNFHISESSLLMLVTAFGGYERVMAAYRYAVRQRYRFFSYGDAMWLEPPAKESKKKRG